MPPTPSADQAPGLTEPRPCGACALAADALFFDGRRHLCEPCFDVLLTTLRNLPPMAPGQFDRVLAHLHGLPVAA